jgi:tetratricopeptide (TPR) repeat protein
MPTPGASSSGWEDRRELSVPLAVPVHRLYLFLKSFVPSSRSPTIVELVSRLQAVVGDTYRIVRELGGGGMSRVFLAEETRLSRQVVIKVLPPEMGAGVNVERFEREIQLAARLQHPHIVPLLTAGASGDLLYYIMPFIAGESLRVRLAASGELPIPDALRILREVSDALAYAHANGVVHRDIKPDNVLLSAGHAVVTDFGVAKAVSASSGGGHLTSLGLALGTPAYMAPEQAAADPHVDHRADIYALGALAYEMLCGRTPFTATSPQALLAAHITQKPEPAAQFRPSISPALNAIVMRCLEKRAADRWQTASELAAQLDAASTPSAGFTPSSAQTVVVSSGTEAALRRGHPARVAAIFVATSVAVMAGVYLLVQRLGLPDWVLYAAAALLLLGLPIMLVTSLHERRRTVARTTGLMTATPPGSPVSLFTWRKAIMGGGLAFAGLGLVAAVYMAMRLLGIGPVGTLVASGVIKDREPIVLADFENRASDSTLGPSVTEAFRVDLSQSPTVRVMDQQAILQGLSRMQRPATGTLPVSLARELAEREGVKAVVSGQIDPVGQGYVLAASLISTTDGRTLSAVRETAEGPGELLKAIDRLSAKLRERIGESLTTIRANPALDQVTTSSLPALRKYSQALRLEEADRVEEAIPLLQEGVALDSGFAMAWRKLAVSLGNTQAPYSQQRDAATHAFDHRDRLPELERDLAVGFYHAYVDYDPDKVIAAYRSALGIDPDNLVSLNNLAVQFVMQRRWAEAESLVTRATRIGRGASFYNNLYQAQVAQGHFADAHATLARYAKASPGSPQVLGQQSMLATAERDFSTAERLVQQVRQEQQSSPFWREVTTHAMALMRERAGKLGEAKRYREDLISQAEARNTPGDYLAESAQLVALDLRYGAPPARVLARLDSALRHHPLESIDRFDRPYALIAYVYARAGQPADAKRMMQEYEKAIPAGVRRGNDLRLLAAGAEAEAEGRNRDALAAYRQWYEETGECGNCGLYEMATVYDHLNLADSAQMMLQRAIDVPTAQGRAFHEPITLAPTYKRLGELYEARGDRKKAAEYYGRFVELWKDSDAQLQPSVREVRGRLAHLSQEPGT